MVLIMMFKITENSTKIPGSTYNLVHEPQSKDNQKKKIVWSWF